MLDANFDPYLELQETKVELLRQQRTLRQLCIAHNHNQEIVNSLVQQHDELVNLVKSTRHQMLLMRDELNQARREHYLTKPQ
jgi:cell division FtsZ-interacting protein ZapD